MFSPSAKGLASLSVPLDTGECCSLVLSQRRGTCCLFRFAMFLKELSIFLYCLMLFPKEV